MRPRRFIFANAAPGRENPRSGKAVGSAPNELSQNHNCAVDGPVYFALCGLSNPDYHGRMAQRLGKVFPDFTLDTCPDRHQFDPPHRVGLRRVASALLAVATPPVSTDKDCKRVLAHVARDAFAVRMAKCINADDAPTECPVSWD